MSIQIGRLNFYNGSKEERYEIMQKVKEELKQRKINIHNIDKGWIEDWHFGNYCLPGVPLDIAQEMVEKYNLDIDSIGNVIEEKDFSNIKINDKVTIEISNFFGGISNCKGTVVDKNDSEIIVRKYKSKNKGWGLRVHERGSIILGW